MKDIDFDELDKAVSSVLGQKTQSEDAAADTNTVDEAKPVAQVSAPSDSVVESQSSESESVAEPVAQDAPKVPLAVKRRGKFMDMVHPSAAMTTKSATPQGVTSRPVPVIEPLSVKLEPEAPTDNLDKADPVSIESTVEHKAEPTAVVDESQTLIGAEPAPLEDGSHTLPASTPDTEPDTTGAPKLEGETFATLALGGEQDQKSDDTTADEAKDETSKVASDDSESTESTLTSAVPPSTPFLADTKVEKRPLGGFVEGEAMTAPETTETDDSQKPPEVPLPRELQPDVMEVESDQSAAPAGASQASAPAFATSVEAAPEPGEDGRVEGHPLFDTSTYHEPIAPVPHKSMPTWLKWLLGLAVCLAIGAGVGYFLFTAGL